MYNTGSMDAESRIRRHVRLATMIAKSFEVLIQLSATVGDFYDTQTYPIFTWLIG